MHYDLKAAVAAGRSIAANEAFAPQSSLEYCVNAQFFLSPLFQQGFVDLSSLSTLAVLQNAFFYA